MLSETTFLLPVPGVVGHSGHVAEVQLLLHQTSHGVLAVRALETPQKTAVF